MHTAPSGIIYAQAQSTPIPTIRARFRASARIRVTNRGCNAFAYLSSVAFSPSVLYARLTHWQYMLYYLRCPLPSFKIDHHTTPVGHMDHGVTPPEDVVMGVYVCRHDRQGQGSG